ncbi:MAG: Spy/CpxP family protein refolding chaperone [Candidatus Aegiribacteria sp.]
MSGKVKAIGIAAAVLMLAAGTAIAQGPGGWDGPSHGGGYSMGPGQGEPGGVGMQHLHPFRMMFRGLDLTDDQRDEIAAIVRDATEEVRDMMAEAEPWEERETFMEMFTSPTLTVADLEESMGRMDEVREEVRDVVFRAIVDVHDVLTAEQLRELADIAEEYGPGMEGPGMGRMHR